MLTRFRSLSFSLVLCLMSHVCAAQWVAIPDSNFGKWLNTHSYSACMQGNSTSGWQMDTTCNQVVHTVSLVCENANIKSIEGVQYFDTLQVINCRYNQITNLPALPSTLSNIYCTYNMLSSISALPNMLWGLECSHNLLDSLPNLPNALRDLYCSYNQLTYLPVLPNLLRTLQCSNNQLDSLPALPNFLGQLVCADNLLSSLPALPNSLDYLYCGYNQLVSLPSLPNTLVTLDCGNNQIAVLPSFPNSLGVILCDSNQITGLPALPDDLYFLDCSSNPNLTCFPELKGIFNLKFDNTAVTCLPNYPQYNTYSSPPLGAVPLCNVFNTNGCAFSWNVNGNVYYDANVNCLLDTLENILSNLKVNLYQNGGLIEQVSTVGGGHYSFNTIYTTYLYSVDTNNLPFFIVCPDTGYYTSAITSIDSLDSDMNFGLRCKPGFNLVAQSIAASTVFRPTSYTQVNITAGDASNFYNAHCAAGVSGAVTVTINGSAHYTAPASGALTPTVNGNTLTYIIADFGAVDFFHDFNIMVQTDTTAVIGDTICITVSVTPTTGDNNPNNNTLTICFPVVGSYDPNDKTAYPAGDIDATQKEITYTVRFQNTGTAEAQHIYITDTLDTDIDEGSFQLLAYSHQPMVQIEQNRVRFNFPNINLPDSNTNEPLSHGYVQYKVKLKDNLPIGTQINNTAHIYFDFNAPVVTNTTTNTITDNTAVKAVSHEPLAVRIFPNPANGSFTVSVSDNLIGEKLSVTDATGKQMAAVQLTIGNWQLSTETWTSGVYFVRAGNSTQKLIIQK